MIAAVERHCRSQPASEPWTSTVFTSHHDHDMMVCLITRRAVLSLSPSAAVTVRRHWQTQMAVNAPCGHAHFTLNCTHDTQI
eukprot:2215762-Rhodomonas_salina.5